MTHVADIPAELHAAADYVRAHTRHSPRVGLVLGSGLSLLADRVEQADCLDYAAIPHFPRSTVVGHSGRLVLGQLGGAQVLVMQGRVHYYEGYSMAQVTMPIRLMQLLGVQILIVTNASGGIRQDWRVGDLMAITDHLNLVGLAGQHPLRGPNDDRFGPRFPDMSRAYDARLLQLLRAQAQARNIVLREGVYAMVSGPSYETPAEVRYLRTVGADAVGMSTVPEVIVARHGGMRVAGISLISNISVDMLPATDEQKVSHQDVLLAGQRAVPVLAELIEALLRHLN
jgi:purine-nucleoside phosphorylase